MGVGDSLLNDLVLYENIIPSFFWFKWPKYTFHKNFLPYLLPWFIKTIQSVRLNRETQDHKTSSDPQIYSIYFHFDVFLKHSHGSGITEQNM